MLKKFSRFRIGLRTVKTVAAVIIAMIIVDSYGATASKLIFAMLGAMAAVQPTFKDSLDSCKAQIVGVVLGALASVLLLALKLPPLVTIGIGIVFLITLYNVLSIRYAPNLACFIVVMVCTMPDIEPISYAVGRIWDTAIGLGVGMLINSLVFPYDNSRQIQATIESLDKELITFLEDMFDGDENLPEGDQISNTVATMASQLRIFTNQKLLMRMARQKEQLEAFRICEGKARELLARMEVLSRMGRPGRLDEENRRKLEACGATIRDVRVLDSVMERDVVTNYHVRQILTIRRELLEALKTK